jgi:hypothetical protein
MAWKPESLMNSPSVRQSVRSFVRHFGLSLSVLRALISVAALSQTDVTVVAGSWYLHGEEGWAGPGQGKQNNNGFRRISVLFFFPLFFDIEILAKFNPKKKDSKISRIYYTRKTKTKISKMFPISLLKNSEISPEETSDVKILLRLRDFVDSVNVCCG